MFLPQILWCFFATFSFAVRTSLGGFEYLFKCSSLPREMIQFDEHIFQLGWFNHQLVVYCQGWTPPRMVWKYHLYYIPVIVLADPGGYMLPIPPFTGSKNNHWSVGFQDSSPFERSRSVTLAPMPTAQLNVMEMVLMWTPFVMEAPLIYRQFRATFTPKDSE